MEVTPTSSFTPKEENLYLASIIIGEEFMFFEQYWETAEESGRVENLEICKDCYDFISSDDPGMMEDVFILDGRMIVQSRVTKVNGIGVEHFVFHMKWCQPKMES